MTNCSCNSPQPKIVLDRINQLITAAHQSAPTPFEIAASIAHRFNNDQTRFDPLATLGLFLPSRLTLPTSSSQPTFDHTPVPHSVPPITYDQHRSAVIRFFDAIYPSTFHTLTTLIMHVLDTHSLLDPPTPSSPGIHRYQLCLIIATFISVHPFMYGTERLHKLAIRRSQSEYERIKHIKSTSQTVLKRWPLLGDPVPICVKSRVRYTGTEPKLFPLAFYTDNMRHNLYTPTPHNPHTSTNPCTITKQSTQIHLPNPIPLTTLIPDFLHFFGYVFMANDVCLHPVSYCIDDSRHHLFYRYPSTSKPTSLSKSLSISTNPSTPTPTSSKLTTNPTSKSRLKGLQSYVESHYKYDAMVILDPVTMHTNAMQGITKHTVNALQTVYRNLYTDIHDTSSSSSTVTGIGSGECLTKVLESVQLGIEYRTVYCKRYMDIMDRDTMICEKFDMAMKWVTCGMGTVNDGSGGGDGLTGTSSSISLVKASVHHISSSVSTSTNTSAVVTNTDPPEIILLE